MIKHDTPWEHYTWENFVDPTEQEYLYNRCLIQLDKEAYESNELFMLNNELQNNNGVLGINEDQNLDQKITSQLNQISNELGYAGKGHWSYSFNITKDFPEKQLYPHNDDFEKLKQYGAGMIKMLVYLGTDTQDYTDWGTKLYIDENRNSFSKEIVFQPGNAFIFIPNKYSYHGTDFNNNLNGYRFMMGAEFVED
tara:strand:+ start:1041 stop:1625 length:585 start_codon:yes stop_codon:yes gene_type:complete